MKTREKKNKKGTRMLNKLLAMMVLVVTVVAIVIMSFVGKEDVEEISAVGTIETAVNSSFYSTVLNTYNFGYTGSYQTFTAPVSGYYKLQVWGAQGWVYMSGFAVGGLGGYSSGVVYLNAGTTLYIYVGGQGKRDAGGYNGGGNGKAATSSTTYCIAGSGGGATDIRVGGTSLYHRMIVAGGGSGGVIHESSSNNYQGYSYANGHAGGGLEGEGCSSEYCGTQYSAGTGGGFGYGANVTDSIKNTTKYVAGAGGGGWYGGGRKTGYSTSDSDYELISKSGGGSGYVLTADSYKPSGYALGSAYYMSHAMSATHGIPSPTVGRIDGKEGDGYARIERLSNGNDTQPALTQGSKIGFKAYISRGHNEARLCAIEKQYKYVVPKTGEYRLKVWGSEGGFSERTKYGSYYSSNAKGGLGGYSEGKVFLKKGTVLYITPGSIGTNGGGTTINDGNYCTGAGGGATDIRVGGTSLNHRMIVAGGGSGAWAYETVNDTKDYEKGYAGGGGSGEGYASEYCGTQTKAGYGGGFGYGASVDGKPNYAAGAGGGGWFGGGRSPTTYSSRKSMLVNANRRRIRICINEQFIQAKWVCSRK